LYAAYFNLREPPFSIAPDPSFLYLSAGHQEALGHLLYGTGQYGGFVQLTGEVGTGKTTIVRSLLAQKLDDVDVAMIHNPRQNELEFVASICDELGVKYPQAATSIKTLVDALNEHLLKVHAAGRRTVLIIDEAQNLAPGVLEQVRLLTNLETDKEKLLRIMLVGQPELATLLERADLRQLASRITARARLSPLLASDTERYIVHRLRVANGAADLFTHAAIRRVHQYTQGIPRLINIVCDRALLGAYARGLRTVTPEVVNQAAAEALGLEQRKPSWQRKLLQLLPRRLPLLYVEAALAIATLIVAGVIALELLGHKPKAAPAAAPNAASPESAESVSPAASASSAAAVSAGSSSAIPTASTSSTPEPKAVATNAAINAASALSTTPVDVDIGALRATAQPLPVVMSRLIGLWDDTLHINRGDNVCRALADSKLGCYRAEGDWDTLAAINRPAILTLQWPEGPEQYVLLRGLDDGHAVLETANGPLRLAIAEIGNLWTGEYLLLWRKEIDDLVIAPKSRNENVRWLRMRLAQVKGEKLTPPVSDRFDRGLVEAVRQFQTAHGLSGTGNVGVRTLMVLADLDRAVGTPTLNVSSAGAPP
jgi:general secretion pathway protein A